MLWRISLVLMFLTIAWADPVVNKLDLSPAQIQRIREQRLVYRTEQKQLNERMQQKQQELQDLLQADHPDKARINKTTAELNLLQNELNSKRVDAAFKVRQELTQEQRQQLQRLQEQRETKRLMKLRRRAQALDSLSAEERQALIEKIRGNR